MMRSIGICLVAVASCAVFGQEKAAPSAFEVVSVKPTPQASCDMEERLSPASSDK